MNNKLYEAAKAVIDFCWDMEGAKPTGFTGLWKGATVISNSTEFIHRMYELYEVVQTYKSPIRFFVRIKAFWKRIPRWTIVIRRR